MDEKAYIYERLKFLTEQNIYQEQLINKLINNQECLLESIDKLGGFIEKISTPEFYRKMTKQYEMNEMAQKIKTIQNSTKKQ